MAKNEPKDNIVNYIDEQSSVNKDLNIDILESVIWDKVHSRINKDSFQLSFKIKTLFISLSILVIIFSGIILIGRPKSTVNTNQAPTVTITITNNVKVTDTIAKSNIDDIASEILDYIEDEISSQDIENDFPELDVEL